jgi:hypothetical protein
MDRRTVDLQFPFSPQGQETRLQDLIANTNTSVPRSDTAVFHLEEQQQLKKRKKKKKKKKK